MAVPKCCNCSQFPQGKDTQKMVGSVFSSSGNVAMCQGVPLFNFNISSSQQGWSSPCFFSISTDGVSADGGLDFRFKPRMDLALKVMSQFGEHVDAPRVLRMIPDDVNLKSLSAFLEVGRRRPWFRISPRPSCPARSGSVNSTRLSYRAK